MRLLFDENLSARLVEGLEELYPDSEHVREAGLESASDEEVWDYASRNGLVIVSKDSDFHQRGFLLGHPPKVVWIRRGNCSTADIEALLRESHKDLAAFAEEEHTAVLILN